MHQLRITHFAIALAGIFSVSFYGWAQLGGPSGVMVPYQGFIERDATPLSEDVDLTFRVFGDEVGGGECHSETQTVTAASGRFSVTLGPVPEGCVIDQDVWLEISTPSGTLPGRQRVVPAIAAVSSGTGDFNVTGELAADTITAGDATVAGETSTTSLAVSGSAVIGSTIIGSAVIGNATVGAEISNGRITLRDPAQGGNGQRVVIDGNQIGAFTDSGRGTLFLDGDPVSLFGRFVVNGDANVTGRIQRTEYDVSCAEGSATQHFPYCCRTHVRTGVTNCKQTNTTTGGAWNNITSPFAAAGSNGPYAIACHAHLGGVNFAFCCRSDGGGGTACMVNTSPFFTANWASAGNPF